MSQSKGRGSSGLRADARETSRPWGRRQGAVEIPETAAENRPIYKEEREREGSATVRPPLRRGVRSRGFRRGPRPARGKSILLRRRPPVRSLDRAEWAVLTQRGWEPRRKTLTLTLIRKEREGVTGRSS